MSYLGHKILTSIIKVYYQYYCFTEEIRHPPVEVGSLFIPLFPSFLYIQPVVSRISSKLQILGFCNLTAPRYSQVHLLQSDQKDHKQFRGPGQLPPGFEISTEISGGFESVCLRWVNEFSKAPFLSYYLFWFFFFGGGPKKSRHLKFICKKQQQQKSGKFFPCIEKESLKISIQQVVGFQIFFSRLWAPKIPEMLVICQWRPSCPTPKMLLEWNPWKPPKLWGIFRWIQIGSIQKKWWIFQLFAIC